MSHGHMPVFADILTHGEGRHKPTVHYSDTPDITKALLLTLSVSLCTGGYITHTAM